MRRSRPMEALSSHSPPMRHARHSFFKLAVESSTPRAPCTGFQLSGRGRCTCCASIATLHLVLATAAAADCGPLQAGSCWLMTLFVFILRLSPRGFFPYAALNKRMAACDWLSCPNDFCCQTAADDRTPHFIATAAAPSFTTVAPIAGCSPWASLRRLSSCRWWQT